MRLLASVVVLLVVVLTFALAADEASSDQNQGTKFEEARCELTRLFDFEPFKRLYRKHYNSAMEEMRRLKTFLARCYQVFITAVGYLHRSNAYYLRLNEWTDLLPEEIEAIRNKFATSDMLQEIGAQRGARGNFEGAETLVEQEQPKVRRAHGDPELRSTAANDQASKSANRSPGLKRRKRDSDKIRPKFSIVQAFTMRAEDGTPSEGSPSACASQAKPESETKSKPDSNPESKPTSNQRNSKALDYSALPDYKSLTSLRVFRKGGRNYDHLPVKANYEKLNLPSKVIRTFLNEKQLVRGEAERRKKVVPKGEGRSSEGANNDNNGDGDDVLWVDHRIGGCIQPIQNQGMCGSCYAFAMMAYLEWFHCSGTAQRVKLSEQYVVDCGPQLDQSMKGCGGGNYYKTSEFISNFGLELAKDYPYFGAENRCPHERGKDMHSMGYLRADASTVLMLDMKDAEHYLDSWTILLVMHAADDFLWYGGGVWASKSCGDKGDHLVLVVGHGREDGEEYWLIRNSHGLSWGEQGYMKLNKNSKCIFTSTGFIFGTRNGLDRRMALQRNEKVAQPLRPRPSVLSWALKPMQAMKVVTRKS